MRHLLLLGTVLAAPSPAVAARGDVQAATGPRRGVGPVLTTVALGDDELVLGDGSGDWNETATSKMMVFDFRRGEAPWRSIDDRVMGGISKSRMEVAEGSSVFRGVVSLEQNGGFASVRSLPADHDLSGFDGLTLRVGGDGKTYGFRVRTDGGFDGVSYEAILQTEPDIWIEVQVPWSAFTPVFRGRRLLDHPPLDPSQIKTFGFLIAQRQEGPFELQVEWIQAYGRRP